MKTRIARFISLLFLAVSAGIAVSSCNTGTSGSAAAEASSSAPENLPVFTLTEESTFDFGKVKDGEIVEKSFAFKNTGASPLIISNISASCGCTTPEWPKEPIAPGSESSILVKFNSTGKPGQQNKTVTITANTEPSVIELHIKGVVEGK